MRKEELPYQRTYFPRVKQVCRSMATAINYQRAKFASRPIANQNRNRRGRKKLARNIVTDDGVQPTINTADVINTAEGEKSTINTANGVETTINTANGVKTREKRKRTHSYKIAQDAAATVEPVNNGEQVSDSKIESIKPASRKMKKIHSLKEKASTSKVSKLKPAPVTVEPVKNLEQESDSEVESIKPSRKRKKRHSTKEKDIDKIPSQSNSAPVTVEPVKNLDQQSDSEVESIKPSRKRKKRHSSKEKGSSPIPIPSQSNPGTSAIFPTGPCNVCGTSDVIAVDKYNWICCAKCHAFYTAFINMPYQHFCIKNGDCEINPSTISKKGSRSKCKACWVAKCILNLPVRKHITSMFQFALPRIDLPPHPLLVPSEEDDLEIEKNTLPNVEDQYSEMTAANFVESTTDSTATSFTESTTTSSSESAATSSAESSTNDMTERTKQHF